MLRTTSTLLAAPLRVSPPRPGHSSKLYVSSTSDASLPLVNPIDANGEQAARPFISEINPATHTMLFSSFVGRVDLSNRVATGETINGIAVDSTGNIYLAGVSQLGI